MILEEILSNAREAAGRLFGVNRADLGSAVHTQAPGITTVNTYNRVGGYRELRQAAEARNANSFTSQDVPDNSSTLLSLTPLMWDEVIPATEFELFTEKFFIELELLLEKRKTDRPDLRVIVELPPILAKGHGQTRQGNSRLRVRIRAFCFVELMQDMRVGEFCLPDALPLESMKAIQAGAKAVNVRDAGVHYTFDIRQYKPGTNACRLISKE